MICQWKEIDAHALVSHYLVIKWTVIGLIKLFDKTNFLELV